ncbi:MAG: MFS transporter [Deltaproteobacteria bacterium]|nr:MFS transporter [Deltaproteobacteria bacterium]
MTVKPADNHDKMFRFLLVLTVASTAGLLGWRTLLNNFAVEVLGIEGYQIGILQGLREIPGFLTLLVIYILLLIREVKMASLSIVIFGIGIGITGVMPNFFGILTTTLIMSFGFHFYAALGQSLGLQYYDQDAAPVVFGKLRGYAAAGSIAMAIVIYFLSKRLGFSAMFALIGFCISAAGLWCLMQDPTDKDLVPQHKKMIFRTKYWLFYALTFMSGARRQIFVAFAVFLLVQKFHYTVSQISLLFIVTNVITFFSSPLIGKAVVRFGERKVLSVEYGSLILIFFVYAVTDSKLIIGITYVLDHLFFNFSIAINTFFQKIAHPADIGSSMAVGFTINHIAAVVLPVVGGLLWMVDYKITFFGGMALAFISLILVQLINRQTES